MSFWNIKGVMHKTVRHIMGNGEDYIEVRCFSTVTRRPVTVGDIVLLDGDTSAARPVYPVLPRIYGVCYKEPEPVPVIEVTPISGIIPMELPELPNIEAFLREF